MTEVFFLSFKKKKDFKSKSNLLCILLSIWDVDRIWKWGQNLDGSAVFDSRLLQARDNVPSHDRFDQSCRSYSQAPPALFAVWKILRFMKTIKWVIITIGESKGSTIELTITIVIKTIIICYLHTSFSLSETDFSRREIGSIFPEESQSQQIRVNEYVDGISPEFCQDMFPLLLLFSRYLLPWGL